jgi:alkylation response protein AidB-like acyl-CoA dehydrogenase
MPADRLLPTEEAADLLRLTREIVAKELAPRVAEVEATETFPREVFRTLGRTGLLSLPYPEEYGGGGQPYEVYLQVLEEIGAVWASVGVGVSVHALSCFGLYSRGTEEQRQRWLPDMLGGELLGAYALSEPHAGSDPAAMTTKAVRDGDDYVLSGTKAWITHGGHADFYKVMARTGDDRNGISCFLVPADADGLAVDPPERKMGLTGSSTTTLRFDKVRVPEERRLGAEGEGLRIALEGLDSGRLGIAAVATGLAQGALDVAVAYAQERTTFGRRIIDHQGLAFVLADMAAAVGSARATLLHAARLRDRGLPFAKEASIAKLVATDNAMKVTTDAVQVLGGYGYTRDFPVERYMREAKVMQIFEGTNQIQRMVIGRHLDRSAGGTITSL